MAVVLGRYDNIEIVLKNFRLSYDLLELQDLEDYDKISNYRSIFLPCGIDHPMESTLNVLAHRARFKSVTLRDDYHEVDIKAIGRNIRKFVKRGGAAYFSGYSYKYLQEAFGVFEFFDNFPYMGMPARIESRLMGDLSRFCMKNRMAMYMTHPGWITIKSAQGSEVLAESSFETVRGMRTGPVNMLFNRGDGTALYTSYDSTVYSDFRRFNIYLVAGKDLVSRMYDITGKWGQMITGRIVDAFHNGEFFRMYRFDLYPGENTIYIESTKDLYQVDILDGDGAIMESRDPHKKRTMLSVNSNIKDTCYVKMYPATEGRFGMYAIVSARGKRIFPYFTPVLIACIVLAALGGGFAVRLIFFSKKFSGRFR